MKLKIIFLFFFHCILYSQGDTFKNVIVINNNIRSVTNKTPKIKINGILTPNVVYKSFIVQRYSTDSIEIKIPYRNIFLAKKEIVFRFLIADKNNYFIYTYKGVIATPIVKQVTGDDLVKLKQDTYVSEKIKEFSLEN